MTAIAERLSRSDWSLPGAALALAALALVAALAGSAALLTLWLALFVAAYGLVVGSLGLLAIGHLLGSIWLDPIRRELEAVAATLPAAFILALPLAAALAALYPWAAAFGEALPEARAIWLSPALLLLRGTIYFAVWAAIAWWLTRPGRDPRRGAVAAVLLSLTAMMAGMDWVMPRDPAWWPSLFGFSLLASQLLAALALANLLDLAGAQEARARRLKSLELLLLALAILTLWMWFAQFLVAWMGNLPGEAGWYEGTNEAAGWLQSFIVVPALALAIAILIPPKIRRLRIMIASALLLLQHVAHSLWLARPALADASLLDLAIAAAGLIAFAALILAALVRRQRAR